MKVVFPDRLAAFECVVLQAGFLQQTTVAGWLSAPMCALYSGGSGNTGWPAFCPRMPRVRKSAPWCSALMASVLDHVAWAATVSQSVSQSVSQPRVKHMGTIGHVAGLMNRTPSAYPKQKFLSTPYFRRLSPNLEKIFFISASKCS